MSNERQKRLERLYELRAKQLDQRVGELQAARKNELAAEQLLEQARERKVMEVAKRDERARAGVEAADWGQAENWLKGLAEQEVVVEQRRLLAARAVEEARARVGEARTEQEKIQLLIKRAVEEARQIAARLSQKQDDEFGARLAGRAGR